MMVAVRGRPEINQPGLGPNMGTQGGEFDSILFFARPISDVPTRSGGSGRTLKAGFAGRRSGMSSSHGTEPAVFHDARLLSS